MENRGFCGIGIYNCIKDQNIGTLFRSAHSLGANFIFTIGRKYDRQAADTTRAYKHIPLHHYENTEDFIKHIPYGARLVGIELDDKARPLHRYTHHERAVYVLGSENMGLSKDLMGRCMDIVEVPGTKYCLNVATAGSIVLWHRRMQYER